MVKRFEEEDAQEQPEQQDSDLLTVEEVARILRWDTTTVRRHIINGSLEAVKLPHKGKRQSYRIKKAVLEKILEG